MRVAVSVFLACLFVAAACPAFAVNYFVDPSSSGLNQGTFSNPWRSIADVPWYIDYFKPGDTVFFKRGQQYTGTLSINSSGSSSAPIVFMPYGSGNAPVFQYDVAHPTDAQIYDRTIIRLSMVDHVVIDGFELTDVTIPTSNHYVTAHVGYGVYIYAGPNNKGSHNIIKNVTISKLGAGVAIDGGTDNTVRNCVITNMRMILNTPNVAWDDFGANGIIVKGSNNSIMHNYIAECWGPSYDYHMDGGAIEMYGAVSNNRILYNMAYDNLGWMEFGSGSGGQALNNVVGYNLLINNGVLFWINTEGPYGLDVQNLQFYNNNVVETYAPRIPEMRHLIGISRTPTVRNVLTMKNNIFWLTNSINVTDPSTQPFNGSQLVHQNNLFHMGTGSMGYTLDVTERVLNPDEQVFANITDPNPVYWNYTLRTTSAAIDFGQHTGIVKDYYDQDVPGGNMPDAGIAENFSSYKVVLPLQFISCRAWATTSGNTLEWETNNDVANHFEIERSNNGNNFKRIAVVPYKSNAGTTTVKYQYVDNDVKGEIQYYRIKAIEPDTASYSQIVSIKSGGVSSAKISLSPNPARDYVYVRVAGNDYQNKELVLLTMSGVALKTTRINQAGSPLKLDVSMLPAGAYIVKLTDTKTGEFHSTIFTK